MERLEVLVTQNIDGLHQLAGHSEDKVIELHGTNRKIECQTCGQLSDPNSIFEEFERTHEPPLCRCEGFLKPATISFGQAMPHEKLKEAFSAASRADLVLAIGSTLEVEPAASVPRSAKEQGAVYIIVNQGPTAQDQLADLRIEGDATTVLPAALRELLKLIRR
jgi:NAD-dependent deacetylase